MNKLAGGVLPAKDFIVDDRIVFVGSQNRDWRALTQIHEIGAVVRNTRLAKTFAAAFDFEKCASSSPTGRCASRYRRICNRWADARYRGQVQRPARDTAGFHCLRPRRAPQAGKAPVQTLTAIFERDRNGSCVHRIEPDGHNAPPRAEQATRLSRRGYAAPAWWCCAGARREWTARARRAPARDRRQRWFPAPSRRP